MLIPRLAFLIVCVCLLIAIIVHTLLMTEHLQIKTLSEKSYFTRDCFKKIAIYDIIMKFIIVITIGILVISTKGL